MDLPLPGGRDVRATLSDPADPAGPGAVAATPTRTAVAACPPHPQFGGARTDRRLRAVGDALGDRGVACLRFDYGPWDGGDGERTDVETAVGWLRERYDRVGLFGYSFGGGVAVLAGAALARRGTPPGAVSALAPASRLGDDATLDAVAALEDLPSPLQVVYGSRDETADWRPLVDRARERGADTVEYPADHHFVGQSEKVAGVVGDFLADELEG